MRHSVIIVALLGLFWLGGKQLQAQQISTAVVSDPPVDKQFPPGSPVGNNFRRRRTGFLPDRRLRDEQMPEVDRVERAAKQTEFHISISSDGVVERWSGEKRPVDDRDQHSMTPTLHDSAFLNNTAARR